MADTGCGPEVRARYGGPAFAEADVPEIVALLERCGARHHLERRTSEATREAHEALSAAEGRGDSAALAELHALLDSLLTRET